MNEPLGAQAPRLEEKQRPTNKYRAKCHECFCTVKPGDGFMERDCLDRVWLVTHKTGALCEKAKETEPFYGYGGYRRRSGDWDEDPGYSDLGIETYQG